VIPDEGNSQSRDRYVYVNNAPVNFTDPTGHRIDNGCGIEGCSAEQGEEYRDYVYNVLNSSENRRKNSAKVEAVVNTTVQLELGIVSSPVALLYQLVNDEKVSGVDLAFAVIPGVGKLVSEDTYLLRWVAESSHADGVPWSTAFKDPNLSVFDEALGATPELVQEVMGNGTGKVYGLKPNEVLQIPGVTSLEKTLGETGNSILDTAHINVINSGTNSVARALRNLAVLLFGGG
jgi:hypothetical protein